MEQLYLSPKHNSELPEFTLHRVVITDNFIKFDLGYIETALEFFEAEISINPDCYLIDNRNNKTYKLLNADGLEIHPNTKKTKSIIESFFCSYYFENTQLDLNSEFSIVLPIKQSMKNLTEIKLTKGEKIII